MRRRDDFLLSRLLALALLSIDGDDVTMAAGLVVAELFAPLFSLARCPASSIPLPLESEQIALSSDR